MNKSLFSLMTGVSIGVGGIVYGVIATSVKPAAPVPASETAPLPSGSGATQESINGASPSGSTVLRRPVTRAS